MMLLMSDAFLLYGLRFNSSDEGGSVPRARAPIVSMIKFTQSIITEEGERYCYVPWCGVVWCEAILKCEVI